MKDIQGQRDDRRINIRKVGVKNVSYPVTVLDKASATQKTVASINMYVNLPHQFKGTHMSRFVEILNRFHGEINLKNLQQILLEMKERLQAEAAHLEIAFPYFLKRDSDQAGAVGIKEYQCVMHGSFDEAADLVFKIRVPISPPIPSQADSCLPRSLGHWGLATLSLRFRQFIWIEDIIGLVEKVTAHRQCWPDAEPGQEPALSVEGLTQALGCSLSSHPAVSWFSVLVENLSEGYSTFASVQWPKGHPTISS